jgi:hypothetical protein
LSEDDKKEIVQIMHHANIKLPLE